MDMDQTRLRLIELAAERGVSLASLSRLIGKNASYLQQFLRKGSPRKLEENDRGLLARFFGVAETELGASAEKYGDGPARTPGGWIDIPRLRLQASAGPGAQVDHEDAIGSFRFSQQWLRDQGLQPARLSAIAVRGDSMEPTLRDGDEILVEEGARAPRDGIHVVRFEGTLLVKRVDTSRAGRVRLISDNPAYSPIDCAAEDVELVGRAVWKSGRL